MPFSVKKEVKFLKNYLTDEQKENGKCFRHPIIMVNHVGIGIALTFSFNLILAGKQRFC